MTQYTDVMIDIETLGLGDSPLVFAIGAVKFNRHTGDMDAGVHLLCDPNQYEGAKYPADITASTVAFWMNQQKENPSAAAVFFESFASGSSPAAALESLRGYLVAEDTPLDGDFGVWGNGALFDNNILIRMHRDYGVDLPWKFWQDRCYRTLRAVMGMVRLPPRPQTAHNALYDAKYQATCAHLMLAKATT